jgi:predicted transcriptional regulator
MKTIREIANELGVDKQKVYRFIKQNHINEAHHEALQRSGVKYYDEAAETLIKQGFSDETASMKRFLMRLLRCYKRNLR